MQQLAGLITEVTVINPSNIFKSEYIKELYSFFKNDKDIFKDSKIQNEIQNNLKEILEHALEIYNDVFRERDIENKEEDPEERGPLNNINDFLDDSKATMGSEDSIYRAASEFIFPSILSWLKQTGWKFTEDSDFSKDNRTENMFSYIEPFDNYDTSPSEMLMLEFEEYIEDNWKEDELDEQLEPLYKAGDKFHYRGSEQTVIEDDGIIIKTKDNKGQERKFNHNQVKNQAFPKLG